jgi:hypothetical protein
LFALCCVCCSFKVCGFPFSHLVGKPVRKVCWESFAHGVQAHGHTYTTEITCHWTGAWPQNKGLMHSGLLTALLLRAPPLTCKNTGSRPFMVMRWCSNTLTVHLGALLKRSIRTAVVDAQQQLATGSVPRWRCPRCRSWHSGAT